MMEQHHQECKYKENKEEVQGLSSWDLYFVEIRKGQGPRKGDSETNSQPGECVVLEIKCQKCLTTMWKCAGGPS